MEQLWLCHYALYEMVNVQFVIFLHLHCIAHLTFNEGVSQSCLFLMDFLNLFSFVPVVILGSSRCRLTLTSRRWQLWEILCLVLKEFMYLASSSIALLAYTSVQPRAELGHW